MPTGGRHQPDGSGRGGPAGGAGSGGAGPDPHRNNRGDDPRRGQPSRLGRRRHRRRQGCSTFAGPWGVGGVARGGGGRRGGTPPTRVGEKTANRTPAEGVGTNAGTPAAHSAWRLCRAGRRGLGAPSQSHPPLQAKGTTPPPPPRPDAPGAEVAAGAPLRKRGVAPRRFTRCFCPQTVPPRRTSRGGSWGGEGRCARNLKEGAESEPLSKPAQLGDCWWEAPPRNHKGGPPPWHTGA